VVHLIHASDGCLPSDMATGSAEEIEEELRLAYVAMTRARNFLYVEWPVRYYHSWHRHTDRHTYAQMSRFLSPPVCATMEAVQAGLPESEEESSSQVKPDASPASRIRSRWS
jgi:DNA helicase-2/ATP-dependent DNA helicase PcrA